MDRWLIAAVVGLMIVGCAVGVEEPLPAPPEPAQKVRPPAPTTFSDELVDADESATGNAYHLPPVPVPIASPPPPPPGPPGP